MSTAEQSPFNEELYQKLMVKVKTLDGLTLIILVDPGGIESDDEAAMIILQKLRKCFNFNIYMVIPPEYTSRKDHILTIATNIGILHKHIIFAEESTLDKIPKADIFCWLAQTASWQIAQKLCTPKTIVFTQGTPDIKQETSFNFNKLPPEGLVFFQQLGDRLHCISSKVTAKFLPTKLMLESLKCSYKGLTDHMEVTAGGMIINRADPGHGCSFQLGLINPDANGRGTNSQAVKRMYRAITGKEMDDIKPGSYATEQANQYVDDCLPPYEDKLTHDVIADTKLILAQMLEALNEIFGEPNLQLTSTFNSLGPPPTWFSTFQKHSHHAVTPMHDLMVCMYCLLVMLGEEEEASKMRDNPEKFEDYFATFMKVAHDEQLLPYPPNFDGATMSKSDTSPPVAPTSNGNFKEEDPDTKHKDKRQRSSSGSSAADEF